MQRRLDEEQRTRDAWVEAHEKFLDQQEAEKKAKRKAQNDATTAFLATQIAAREKASAGAPGVQASLPATASRGSVPGLRVV